MRKAKSINMHNQPIFATSPAGFVLAFTRASVSVQWSPIHYASGTGNHARAALGPDWLTDGPVRIYTAATCEVSVSPALITGPADLLGLFESPGSNVAAHVSAENLAALLAHCAAI